MSNSVHDWVLKSKKKLYDYSIFSAAELRSLGPQGKEGRFIVLDAPDWAVVIPVMEKNGHRQIVAVRQYRHGAEQVMMEFPGGVVEKGEEAAKAAARELEEETGYRAGTLEKLGECSPNPAFMTNRFHIFLAGDLTRSGQQNLDEFEFVDVELVPEEEVFSAMGKAPWNHALMTTALWYYQNRERK